MSDDAPAQRVNPNAPHVARIYDYVLGGKDNFAADRDVTDKLRDIAPSAIAAVRANRAFHGRAVHHLAADVGVRQFLDIGTGLPAANNTHEVAQRVAPESRIVYVDNDPMVLVHARALLTSAREGATDYIEADARDVDTILHTAARTLDFTQPVAVMLVAILHCVPDRDNPHGLIARLTDAVPTGSHLVLSHPAADILSEEISDGAGAETLRAAGLDIEFRTREQIARFFDGWDLLEPGLTPTNHWRSGTGPTTAPMPTWAGVARKQ